MLRNYQVLQRQNTFFVEKMDHPSPQNDTYAFSIGTASLYQFNTKELVSVCAYLSLELGTKKFT
jgi:hypothetical protein